MPSRRTLRFVKLASSQTAILRALATGYQLKSHRYLDGTKVSRLHGANGEAVSAVSAKDVERLEMRGLIAGNMKFPASAYLLTERGAWIAASLTHTADMPVSVRIPSGRHNLR